jgi:glycolate oxidase
MHPLPDLGMFLGWSGTTGIITKVSLRLFPRKQIMDMDQFVVEDEDLVPEIIYKITHTEMAGDVVAFSQAIPPYASGLHHINIHISGDSNKEVEFKREVLFDDTLGEYIRKGIGGIAAVSLPVERPQVSKTSDWRKGGGFEYVGAIMPVAAYPQCYRQGIEISTRHDIPHTALGRTIGRSHAMMFSWTYAFNRADSETIRQSREALHETDDLVMEMEGAIWKPGVYGQRLMLDRMDPSTRQLMKTVKNLLDPNGIMNPGNWEVV